MTQFAMQGQLGDRKVILFWQDGKISGDPEAVERLQRLASDNEGYSVPSLAGFTHRHHLQDPYSTVTLIEMVLGRNAQMIAGSLPPLPEPPEGAVM